MSYQYRDPHVKDKAGLRPSYNMEIPIPGKDGLYVLRRGPGLFVVMSVMVGNDVIFSGWVSVSSYDFQEMNITWTGLHIYIVFLAPLHLVQVLETTCVYWVYSWVKFLLNQL